MNGDYRFSQELSVGVSIPWIEGIREERGAPDRRLSGLGDLSMMVRWRPWAAESDEHPMLSGITLMTGLEFPTGEDNAQPFTGLTSPSLFQLGNGTFNPKLGVSYYHQLGDWSIFGSVLGTFPLGESDAKLSPGHYVQATLGGGFRLTENLQLQRGVNGLFCSRDELDGEDVENTGSVTLSVAPALRW